MGFIVSERAWGQLFARKVNFKIRVASLEIAYPDSHVISLSGMGDYGKFDNKSIGKDHFLPWRNWCRFIDRTIRPASRPCEMRIR